MKKKNIFNVSGKRKAVFLGIIALLILLTGLFFIKGNKDFDYENNKLSYPQHRSPPKYSIQKINDTENFTTYKIIYDSAEFLRQESKIYGLLYVPHKLIPAHPSILFLPGGGVKKEDEPAAIAFANLGCVVLVIDQRGIGETSGFYPNYEEDRLLFANNKGSVQHLGVYDALRGIDVLRNLDYVDKNNIMIGGSSMGGRYALIAAGLDSQITKAIIISSSGFHIEKTSMSSDPYFLSIDPDRYINDISPSKLVMIHSKNDSMIKLEDATYTFSLALEPKQFYMVENCEHGFCLEMTDYLKKELLSN